MRKHSRRAGLSLVELAAGTVMVVTSLLGATAAVVSGASLSQEVGRMRASARAAASVMEDVRASDFDEIVNNYDGTSVRVCDEESGLENGTASISVVQLGNGSLTHRVYEVTIVVSFDGATDDQSQRIVTYASNRVAGSSLGGSDTTLAVDEDVGTTQTDTTQTDTTETDTTTEGQ